MAVEKERLATWIVVCNWLSIHFLKLTIMP